MSRTDATHGAARVLSAVPYFAGLDTRAMEAVAQAAIRRDYEAGQVVFLEGEPCAGLYVVEGGWLKVIKLSPARREQVLRFVGSGEVFGGASVFAGSPNPATVVALEPSTVWIVRRDVMLRLLDQHPGLARTILQNLAKHMLQLVARPEACEYTGLCEMICPTGAIQRPFEIAPLEDNSLTIQTRRKNKRRSEKCLLNKLCSPS